MAMGTGYMSTNEQKPAPSITVEGEYSDVATRLENTRLRAENRRLEVALDKFIEEQSPTSNSNLIRTAQLRDTILRQQVELTKLNRALQKKGRGLKIAREQIRLYREWASRSPLDGDPSLLQRTKSRILAINLDRFSK